MAVSATRLLVLTLGLAMAATSSAVVYKVGDSNGWTILGNPNYSDWAGKKTFHVGDTIAAGEALGENPGVGIIAAEQRMQKLDFELQKFRDDDGQIEAKYRTMQEDMQNVHWELTNNEKQKMMQALDNRKTDIDNRKVHRSILEEQEHDAKVQYEREVLSSQQ